MAMETLNPATDELVKSFDVWGEMREMGSGYTNYLIKQNLCQK